MKKVLFLFLAFPFCLQAQLHFTYVSPADQQVTIRNFGPTETDISTYRFCSLFEYAVLNQASVTILSGDLVLSAGEEVTLQWNANTGFSSSAADMGLYLPAGAFTNPANMVAFMEYGGGGLGRENVAVSAGLWATNTFVAGTGPFYYTGDGSQSGVAWWSLTEPGGPAVVINEVDCDQVMTDAQEFVELYSEPNTDLSGLVVVFFQGGAVDNASYASFDLDGFSTDENGFFVLGNIGVPSAQLIFNDNFLQNGEDAVALYQGNAADWPNGTLPSSTNLVDALVYGTNDPDDTELLAILTPGQPQLNESATGNSTANSISRIPDGGEPFMTSLYVIQVPTPGATNILSLLCSAGSLTTDGGSTSFTFCSEDDNAPVQALSSSTIENDTYIYVVTDASGLIIATDDDGLVDPDDYADGEIRIYGLSYTGTLSGADAGLPVSGITSDDCLSLSSNYIAITTEPCVVDGCDGGTVSSTGGSAFFSICSDGEADLLSFANVSGGNVNYTYIVTNASNAIVAFGVESFDFDALAAGTYLVWGFSYAGNADPSTTETGDDATLIIVDGICSDLSSNSITVVVQECELGEGCAELFISEYVEGTGFNKALEVFNPTNFPVDLTGYGLYTFNNGATEFSSTLALSGTLEPFGTYVVVNPSADAPLLAIADATGNVANFNGDDAIQLRFNDVVLDQIGEVGVDPGTEWTFGPLGTEDQVLVRKPEVSAPTTNWTLSAGQWDVYPLTDLSFIGNHSFYSCSSVPQIGFSMAVQSTTEEAGVLSISVQAYNIPAATDVTLEFTGGTATPDADFTNIFPVAISFPAGSSTQLIELSITDDLDEEEEEFLQLALSSATEVNWVIQAMTLTIAYSDPTYDLYDIAQVTGANEAGVMDSIGTYCELRGVVHGINFNSDGIHFHLIDATDGIKVFDADEDFGYVVAEGDSVHVLGQVEQFMGQAEIRPVSITLIDGGHPLTMPIFANVLDESMESHLVTVSCVAIADPENWNQEEPGFNVLIESAEASITVWVDADSDIFQNGYPQGHFTITGIVEQEDATEAYDSGYRIWPRYMADFSEQVIASFNTFTELQFGNDGAEVEFINASTGAVNYAWNFGDGNGSNEINPTHTYSYDWLLVNPEITVMLMASNELGCTDTLTMTAEGVFVGLEELADEGLVLFPNPVVNLLTIRSTHAIEEVVVRDTNGRIVASTTGNLGSQLTLELGDLAPGMYVVSTRRTGTLSHVPIVVE